MQDKILKILAIAILLLGCGKYGPPVPPESLGAKAVRDLNATASIEGVLFEWDAPDADRRGQELKTMNGYAIERKLLEKENDALNPDIEFEKVGYLEDKHVLNRDEKRDAAREEGKPSRRIGPDDHLVHFSYLDQGVTPGAEYLYRIVPINQDDVEGEVRQYVKVKFQGDASTVIVVNNSELVAGDDFFS